MAAASSSVDSAVLQRKTPSEVHAMDFEPVDEKTREQCDGIVKAVKEGGEAALLEYAVRFGDLKEGEQRQKQLLARGCCKQFHPQTWPSRFGSVTVACNPLWGVSVLFTRPTALHGMLVV